MLPRRTERCDLRAATGVIRVVITRVSLVLRGFGAAGPAGVNHVL
jgi:hypothetical protein